VSERAINGKRRHTLSDRPRVKGTPPSKTSSTSYTHRHKERQTDRQTDTLEPAAGNVEGHADKIANPDALDITATLHHLSGDLVAQDKTLSDRHTSFE
jgi:hypothetical protein